MSQKPRILIFSLAYIPFVGGAELAVKEITDHLLGYAFDLITYRFDSRWAKKEKIGNVTVYRVGWGRHGGSYYGRTFEKFLFMPAAFFKALTLHRHNHYSLFWSLMASRAAAPALGMKFLYPTIPFFLTIQEGDTPEYAHRRAGILRPLWRMIFRMADSIQCISKYLKAWVIDEGAHPERICVIPNGVDVQKFQKHESRIPEPSPEASYGAGKNQETKIVITTSRLVAKNGIDILIDALAEVKKLIPDVSCVIIGDGPERLMLEMLAKEKGIEKSITFAGDIPNSRVPEELSRASVFVRPSRSEGLGISFLEAMAAGIPIIGTPVGGIPDFLEDGVTGLFVKSEDAHDCAEKIIKLLTDKSLAEKISSAAKDLIRKEYNWHTIAKKFDGLFIGLLKQRNAKKILLVSGIFPPDIGGSATYSHTLLRELPRHGISLQLLTYGKSEQEFNPTNKRPLVSWFRGFNEQKDIIRISRRWPKGIRHGIFFFACLWHARGKDGILSADASMGGGLPAALAAIVMQKRFIVRVTGEYSWEQGQTRFGVTDSLDEFQTKKYHPAVEILRFLEHWLVKRADAVIAPSEYLKHIVVGWRVSPEKISVIYNAISLSTQFHHAFEISFEEARKELGWSVGRKVFVSVGRLVPWKGFDGLLNAFKHVAAALFHATLFIIGDGPELQNLKSQISNLKLENSVKLLGRMPQETLGVYLRAADAFVLNTAYEGFSHQLLEALALGVPIITTHVGGNPEIITDGENGILVPYNDIVKFKNAMENTSLQSKIRERLNNNKGEILKKFNQERMINGLLKIL